MSIRDDITRVAFPLGNVNPTRPVINSRSVRRKKELGNIEDWQRAAAAASSIGRQTCRGKPDVWNNQADLIW